MAPLLAPDLTAVLAEMEETVGGLAEKAANRQSKQHRAQKEISIDSQNLLPIDTRDAGALVGFDSAVSVTKMEVRLDSDVKADACFSGSNLQVAIDSQIRVFEDITNSMAGLGFQDSIGDTRCLEKNSGEAFTDIRFLRHARAKPCRHCNRSFFPRSLEFHEAACEKRVALELVSCPRCSRELRKNELPRHMATCGHAMKRMLEISDRLAMEASAMTSASSYDQLDENSSGQRLVKNGPSQSVSDHSNSSSHALSLSRPDCIEKRVMRSLTQESDTADATSAMQNTEHASNGFPTMSWIQNEIDPALFELESFAQKLISLDKPHEGKTRNPNECPKASRDLIEEVEAMERQWNIACSSFAKDPSTSHPSETSNFVNPAVSTNEAVDGPTSANMCASDPFQQMVNLRQDVRSLCKELSALPGL